MVAGAAVTANATVTPFVGIPANSPLRVHQVLSQDFYNYPGASTSQKNYYHVMRKMFPDASGAPFIPVDGVAQTINFNHTITSAVTPAQGSFDFWRTLEFSYQSTGNPFSTPTKVMSNVSNGALGAFCGYSVQLRTLIVPK